MSNNVTTIKTIIKGTGVICKGNVKGNFEQVPMELFDYIELELISHTDVVVYVKLLQLYNEDYGYAFPTIPQLMIYTRIGSKATIHHSLNTLEEVGLIQKNKTNRGNNIYVVYKPLDKVEFYELVPHKVKKLEVDKAKLMKMNEHDKERLQQHKLNRQAQVDEQQQQQEQAIQLKQIVPKIEPKIETSNPTDLLDEVDEDSDEYLLSIGISEEQIRKMRKLRGKS